MRRRMGRDLQEDIDIGLSRGTDGGKTWEPVRVIMDMVSTADCLGKKTDAATRV
ncbi:MAG: sialidase family protein [Planctomycetaceae bacterium]